MHRVCLFALVTSCLSAQAPADLFHKAPPAVDEALRARVQALTELHRNRPQRSEGGRLSEHSFREVRMHPNPLPLAGAERASLVPDRVRDAESSEALDQRSSTDRSSFLCPQLHVRGRRGGEVRSCPRVPQEIR